MPDVRSYAFADEARRQSSRLAAADHVGDDQDFVDAMVEIERALLVFLGIAG